ncbi:agmatinase [Agarivorans sp. 1_MG-2023]|uniref:agmatinase n=1 Tax=Agarivorans sp. 1_MG-2023 TaxID=3062634 RepID=UPI0026E3E57E|nr:agmatinase [Agarivorans sp. 1_MG-2023]MDO6766113.1 agmatinase [Agarivorans sp. 1_MG-2023]
MSTLADHPDYSLYSNANTFLRQALDHRPALSSADVVITGLPFDLATTGRSGARLGPDAVRRASVNLAWEEKRWPWDFKLLERIGLVDAGDLVFDCGEQAQFTQRVEDYATSLLKAGKTMLSLGGDHFVTLPLLRAHAKHHGKMALLHFDAHTDSYSAGSRYDHGTMFYHAPKEGLIDPACSLQLGIRTDYEKANHPFEVINADHANNLSIEQIVQQIRQRIGDKPLYLSFDIDCLDPAYAPGTGTPVGGGLSTNRILQILRGLQGVNIIGMDVVEVAPAYDNSEVTALAAATIAVELLHLWAVKHR